MARTQFQIASQMAAQQRILDPNISGEVGTPERKIIDTVAQQIAENEIDLVALNGSLDMDAKFGSDLNAFLGLFKFGRLSGSAATGLVTFSRGVPSPFNIVIPVNTQVSASLAQVSPEGAAPSTVTFRTTLSVTLVAGQTSVDAPVEAIIPGTVGNVPADSITQFANLTSVLGITSVTNQLAFKNGSDRESDPEVKIRFRNTVFRNLAGTQDQYLALAVSTQFTTKANVIGPISRWQEFIQVPTADDNSVTSDGTGNGAVGQWTTVTSTNRFAKAIYTQVPYYVTNGKSGDGTIFYRHDTDFALNVPPLLAGDTYREQVLENAVPYSATTPNVTFFNVYTGGDGSVTLPKPGDVVLLEYSYLSTESRNDLTRGIANCVDVYINGSNPVSAKAVIPLPGTAVNQVFSSNSVDKFSIDNFRRAGLPDVRPQIGNLFTGLFFEPVMDLPDQIVAGNTIYIKNVHYYTVVDVTPVGGTVRARNGIEWNATMPGRSTSDPDVKPWLNGMMWSIGDYSYYGNYYGNFYQVTDPMLASSNSPDTLIGWTSVAVPFNGPVISANTDSSITITNYVYDKNVVDLQTALDGNKQITTDVLAHKANVRYFKLDITVVYSGGASVASTNLGIQQAIADYFDGQYFGTTLQLSDMLVAIRSVTGVQNVRWTQDFSPYSPAEAAEIPGHRITETDITGTPRPPVGTTFDQDITLLDNELPSLPQGMVAGDTKPGLIIRPRAQSTFNIV